MSAFADRLRQRISRLDVLIEQETSEPGRAARWMRERKRWSSALAVEEKKNESLEAHGHGSTDGHHVRKHG